MAIIRQAEMHEGKARINIIMLNILNMNPMKT
jgi:hypothetical protein